VAAKDWRHRWGTPVGMETLLFVDDLLKKSDSYGYVTFLFLASVGFHIYFFLT
jgi:hypothetical protein